MKPDSLMAIVEFDNSRSSTGLIEGVPMVDKAELTGWLAELGFHPAQEYRDLFPGKWYVIYARGTAGDRLRHVPVSVGSGAAPPTQSALAPRGAIGPREDPRLSQGTGSLGGVVVERASGRPVPEATVSISLDGGASRRSVMTEPDGTFGFDRVPPGSFYVAVSKRGYSSGAYGMTDPYVRATPSYFELDEGEDATDVVLRLARQGVVRGRVLDERGDPLRGIVVQLRRLAAAEGRAYLALGPRTTTDRDGGYAIPNVTVGRYLVSVPAIPYGGASPSAAASLGVFDRATVYYPGTLAADDATAIEVVDGAEIAAIDVRVPVLQTVTVSGRIRGLDGPATANAELLLDETDRIVTATPVFVARIGSDGTFLFPRVPEGRYVVRVRHFPRPPGQPGFRAGTQTIGLGGGGSLSFGEGPLAPMSDAPAYWAMVPVVVGRTDVEGVEVVLNPAARIRGTVELRGTAPPRDAETLNATALMLMARQLQDAPAFQMARLEADGGFVTAGLPPGQYLPNVMAGLSAAAWTRDWRLESITIGGRAVAAIELGTTDLQDVRLTYVDVPAILSGVVRDAAGSPVPGAFVHVFPADRTASVVGFPGVVRTLRSSRKGVFEAQIPSGEYLIVASVEPDADPDRVSLEPRATRVRVQLGARQSVELVP
jgi:hypothetical protein